MSQIDLENSHFEKTSEFSLPVRDYEVVDPFQSPLVVGNQTLESNSKKLKFAYSKHFLVLSYCEYLPNFHSFIVSGHRRWLKERKIGLETNLQCRLWLRHKPTLGTLTLNKIFALLFLFLFRMAASRVNCPRIIQFPFLLPLNPTRLWFLNVQRFLELPVKEIPFTFEHEVLTISSLAARVWL